MRQMKKNSNSKGGRGAHEDGRVVVRWFLLKTITNRCPGNYYCTSVTRCGGATQEPRKGANHSPSDTVNLTAEARASRPATYTNRNHKQCDRLTVYQVA